MSDTTTKTSQPPSAAQGMPGVPLSEDLRPRLEAPFSEQEVKFKPAMTKGNRALALPYVDARVIMARLDDVFGVAGWQDTYEILTEGSVVCTLRVKIGWEWIAKTDVGGQSEQADEGDRVKAAFSDALKRAAVKFGIGRYLYRQASLWMDWDPQKKSFVGVPRLPENAVAPVNGRPARQPQKAATKSAKLARELPKDGAELEQKLRDKEADLVRRNLCKPGDLMTAVRVAGVKAGYVPELVRWPAPAIQLAYDVSKEFIAACKAGQGPVHAN